MGVTGRFSDTSTIGALWVLPALDWTAPLARTVPQAMQKDLDELDRALADADGIGGPPSPSAAGPGG